MVTSLPLLLLLLLLLLCVWLYRPPPSPLSLSLSLSVSLSLSLSLPLFLSFLALITTISFCKRVLYNLYHTSCFVATVEPLTLILEIRLPLCSIVFSCFKHALNSRNLKRCHELLPGIIPFPISFIQLTDNKFAYPCSWT